MARTAILLAVVCFAVGIVSAETEKRGFIDSLGSAVGSTLAQIGNNILPAGALNAGCSSVGKSNTGATAGGRRRRGIGEFLGTGLAQIGNVLLPSSALEAGCSSVGLYDAGKDKHVTLVVNQQPQQQPQPQPQPQPVQGRWIMGPNGQPIFQRWVPNYQTQG